MRDSKRVHDLRRWVRRLVRFKNTSFSPCQARCFLRAASLVSAPPIPTRPAVLTYLQRLIVLDGIHSKASGNPHQLPRLPVRCKSRPRCNRLEVVLDHAGPGVSPKRGGEGAWDVEGEGEDVAASLKRVRVPFVERTGGVRGGGWVEEGEVVEEEGMVEVMSRRVSPSDLCAAEQREPVSSRLLRCHPSVRSAHFPVKMSLLVGEGSVSTRPCYCHSFSDAYWISLRFVGSTRLTISSPTSTAGSNSSPVSPRRTRSPELARWISSGSIPAFGLGQARPLVARCTREEGPPTFSL